MEWNNHIVQEDGSAICFMVYSRIGNNSEHEAAAELIVYLRNHAPAIIALVKAAEEALPYINDSTIEGGIQNRLRQALATFVEDTK